MLSRFESHSELWKSDRGIPSIPSEISEAEFETKQEESWSERRTRLFTEINFRHDTPTGNFSADLINARTHLFFDAEDLITFLHRLVNHLAEASGATASFLPSHKIKSSKLERREWNTCYAREKAQKLLETVSIGYSSRLRRSLLLSKQNRLSRIIWRITELIMLAGSSRTMSRKGSLRTSDNADAETASICATKTSLVFFAASTVPIP